MDLFILASLVLAFFAIIVYAVKVANKDNSKPVPIARTSRRSSSSNDAGLLILVGIVLLLAASPALMAGKAASGGKGSGLAWVVLIAIIGGGLYFLFRK